MDPAVQSSRIDPPDSQILLLYYLEKVSVEMRGDTKPHHFSRLGILDDPFDAFFDFEVDGLL